MRVRGRRETPREGEGRAGGRWTGSAGLQGLRGVRPARAAGGGRRKGLGRGRKETEAREEEGKVKDRPGASVKDGGRENVPEKSRRNRGEERGLGRDWGQEEGRPAL